HRHLGCSQHPVAYYTNMTQHTVCSNLAFLISFFQDERSIRSEILCNTVPFAFHVVCFQRYASVHVVPCPQAVSFVSNIYSFARHLTVLMVPRPFALLQA